MLLQCDKQMYPYQQADHLGSIPYYTFIDESCLPLLAKQVVVGPLIIASDPPLQVCDNFGKFHVTPLLQLSQNTGLKEHFGVAKTVTILIKLWNSRQYFAGCLFTVHKSSLNCIRSQNGVSRDMLQLLQNEQGCRRSCAIFFKILRLS